MAFLVVERFGDVADPSTLKKRPKLVHCQQVPGKGVHVTQTLETLAPTSSSVLFALAGSVAET